MSYNTKKLLTDADGRPIPQYYDPVTDEFKPMTNAMSISNFPETQNVQLTGSLVRQSTQPRPPGLEGYTLYLWDTKQAFIHDGTDWREV